VSGIAIRDARLADAPAIAAIYAHHVLHGTATYEEVPPDADAMRARIARVLDAGWPYLVAEAAGEPVGFAYCMQFRERPAYRFAAEDSVYVRDDLRGRKVGRALLAALLPRAEACGFRQVFAVIGDAENGGSIGLHAAMGFVQAGRLRACGLKFGRWLDVVIMQRALGAGDASLP
jgi:phosphinothricin acetyltransferase